MINPIFKDKDNEEEIEEDAEQEQDEHEEQAEQEEDDTYRPHIAKREEQLQPGEHRRDKNGRIWLKMTEEKD